MVEAPCGPPAGAVVLNVVDAGARDAGEIQPAMLVEVLILGCEEGVDHELRHRLNRNVEPPLARVFGHQRAVGRVHARHYRRLVVLQLRIVRQVLGVVPQQPGGRSHAHHEQDRARREQKAEEAQHELHGRMVPSCARLQASTAATVRRKTGWHITTAKPPPSSPMAEARPCG